MDVFNMKEQSGLMRIWLLRMTAEDEKVNHYCQFMYWLLKDNILSWHCSSE